MANPRLPDPKFSTLGPTGHWVIYIAGGVLGLALGYYLGR